MRNLTVARLGGLCLLALLVSCGLVLTASPPKADDALVVHEWGNLHFRSTQGWQGTALAPTSDVGCRMSDVRNQASLPVN
jgi:hypothetical protein